MNQTWKTIESAPKDGTWILICGGLCAEEYSATRIVSARYTTLLNSENVEGYWQFACYDGGFYGQYENPTHWMPLPDSPKKVETTERLLSLGFIQEEKEIFSVDRRYRIDVLDDGSIDLMFCDSFGNYISAGPKLNQSKYKISVAVIASFIVANASHAS